MQKDKRNQEFLEKAEQIFKLVDGMTYIEWCRITHIINRKYSSLQDKVELAGGDEHLKDLKYRFYL